MTFLAYRPEIDGLRAIAVLPVIAFHAGLPGFSGGFVGVDVFFVLSGYLITTILLREQAAGGISLIRFYERRARRILPALVLVIVASLIAGFVLMRPWQLAEMGRSIAAVTLFVSNIFFWRTTDYFAGAAEEAPMLHTWSLAVEEQFYLLFPLVLMVLRGLGARWLTLILLGGALLSLALADWASVSRYFTANFYLAPTRAWELLAGSLAAIWLMQRGPLRGWLGELAGLGGLIAICVAIVAFDEGTPFPGRWALAPVLGTMFVVLGAGQATLAGRLLSWRVLVGIGLISYSAYLWHQPLLAFGRIAMYDPFSDPSRLILGILGIMSIPLAWISWRWVERPFRQPGAMGPRTIFTLSAGTMVALILGGLVLSETRAGLNAWPAPLREWAGTSPREFSPYLIVDYSDYVKDAPFPPEGPTLLLIGDSFSQDAYNMLRETNGFADHVISAHYVPTRCQIHLRAPDTVPIAEQDSVMCEREALLRTLDMAQVARADIVMLAGRWRDWAIELLPDTLSHLRAAGAERIVVIGSKGFPRDLAQWRDLEDEALLQMRFDIPDELTERNARLDALSGTALFIDPMAAICDETGCPVFTPQGELISYDGGHLTRAGAAFLGQALFVSGPLGE